MKIYLDVLREIMEKGVDRLGRNGWTRGIFAKQMRFPMSDGFPATTTKRLAFRSVAAELFWFMQGYSNNNELTRLGCKIWTENAESDYWKPKAKNDGDLGRIYGVQWRSWRKIDGTTVDQLRSVTDRIKKDPNDRRFVISAWNPGELEEMALPPCHMLFQFYPANGKLSLHMVQRSCDMFLGVPFNIASYALLLHLIAQMTSHVVDELVITLNDAHIYHDHFDAVREQLERKPRKLPELWINPGIKTIEDLDTKRLKEPNDIYSLVRLEGYNPDKTIKAKMAV